MLRRYGFLGLADDGSPAKTRFGPDAAVALMLVAAGD